MKNNKTGIFITRIKFIRAYQLVECETFIDSNGKQFVGVPGDWKIFDDHGYVYYMNKYQFEQRYQPYNQYAFEIVKK